MKRFDILLVKFPFSDLSEAKLRPAVVIAVPGGDNVICCQVTTKKRSITTYEIPLPRTACRGDIRFDSNIYADMIFTLHSSAILRNLGCIADEEKKLLLESKVQMLFTDSSHVQ